MNLWQDFCILTVGYTKSYHSEKSLKAVNNTPATEIWRLLTCQKCLMICKPYYWDKQHANISPLVLMTDWLMAMHCSQKMTFHFLSVFSVHTSIWDMFKKNMKNIFFEMYLRRLKESQKRHLFWDVFETSYRRRKKTSFLRCIWDVLQASQKRHLFWDVFETS